MQYMVFGWWRVQELVELTDRSTGCGEVLGVYLHVADGGTASNMEGRCEYIE